MTSFRNNSKISRKNIKNKFYIELSWWCRHNIGNVAN